MPSKKLHFSNENPAVRPLRSKKSVMFRQGKKMERDVNVIGQRVHCLDLRVILCVLRGTSGCQCVVVACVPAVGKYDWTL